MPRVAEGGLVVDDEAIAVDVGYAVEEAEEVGGTEVATVAMGSRSPVGGPPWSPRRDERRAVNRLDDHQEDDERR